MIQTVLGPVAPEALGATSMHEHLVSDARVLFSPAREEVPPATTVGIETLGFLRWNLLGLEDNLVLDDDDVAVRELGHAAGLGLRTVVDLTGWGLGAQPHRLPEISRRSGTQVVAGVGVYLDRPHPAWIAGLTDDALTARFVQALDDEFEDAGFRAGILGLIGTSEPITPSEDRVLRAAGTAAGATGAPIVIRLDPSARRGPEVLATLVASGCPAEQVIFGNVDEFLDADYLGELAAAGATLEWCFGNEAYYRDGYRDPTDSERLELFVAMLQADPALQERCVMGCSVWTKTQLRAFGGLGYDHVLRRIVPELRRRGIGAEAIERMLVVNPASLLDR